MLILFLSLFAIFSSLNACSIPSVRTVTHYSDAKNGIVRFNDFLTISYREISGSVQRSCIYNKLNKHFNACCINQMDDYEGDPKTLFHQLSAAYHSIKEDNKNNYSHEFWDYTEQSKNNNIARYENLLEIWLVDKSNSKKYHGAVFYKDTNEYEAQDMTMLDPYQHGEWISMKQKSQGDPKKLFEELDAAYKS